MHSMRALKAAFILFLLLPVVAVSATPANSSPFDALAVTALATTADVGVYQTDSDDPVSTSSSFSYFVTVTNDGPDDATDVTLIDDLPAGVTAGTLPSGCSATTATRITCTIGTLAAFDFVDVEIPVTAPSTVGTITNTASVTTTSTDTYDLNDSATEDTEVVAPASTTADVGVYKSDSNDPVSTSSSFSYFISVTNDSEADATDVTLIDDLPQGVTAGTLPSGCSATTATRITCTIGTLPAFESVDVVIPITAPSTVGTITNTASVTTTSTETFTDNNTTTEDTEVVAPGADLSVFKSSEPNPAPTGGTVTYTIDVSNQGPDTATGVILTDTLPAAAFGTATPSQGTCPAPSAGVLTCNLGSIARDESATVTVTVTAPSSPGTLENTVSVDADQDDPNLEDNEYTDFTDVEVPADLGVTLNDSPDPVATGGTLTYTATVSNAGPNDAPNVTLGVQLHNRLTFVGASSATAGVTCENDGGSVSCSLGTVADGDSVVVTITATKTGPGAVHASARVEGDVGDDNAENDSDVEFTNKASALDLVEAMKQTTGVNVTAASFVATSGPTPHDVQTKSLTGFATEGSGYAILTSGDATLADTPNSSGSSGADLHGASVRGNTDFDVTILKIDLDVPAGPNCLSIDFRFLSEEFPEYVGSRYNDAFIAELDTSNWTTSGSTITAPNNFAFDPGHNEISINAVGAAGMTAAEATGTTYDGATPLLSASTPITTGAHSLYLSIFDQGDHILDSAVFLDKLRLGTTAGTTCQQGATVLSTAKVAQNATTQAGGQNAYTITISNPSENAVTLNTISDELPDGFSYRTGTTTGATTDDPTVNGRQLTWSGSFNVPAASGGTPGTLSLGFGVNVSSTPGDYLNNAGAAGTGVAVTPTGPTAEITVTPASPTRFVADFDASGKDDVAVWRPSNGTWYVEGQWSGTQWGQAGDIPVPGNYDADAADEMAVFRPSSGTWYVLGGWSGTQWGQAGDIPVPGNYDGVGAEEFAVFRPSNGTWYVNGEWSGTPWGQAGDVPVPGNYDADAADEMAVFRPASGTWYVLGEWSGTQWGQAGDIPVPGNYDGLGAEDFAVFRPASGSWYVNGEWSGTQWGQAGDVPLAGDFDADPDLDKTVWRPAGGFWYTEGNWAGIQWGQEGDIP